MYNHSRENVEMNEMFSDKSPSVALREELLDTPPEKTSNEDNVSRDGFLGFYHRRKKTVHRCCCCFWVLMTIMLPLTFAVIIPAVVRNLVENGPVDVQSVTILYPQDNEVQLSISLVAPEVTGFLAWAAGVIHASATANYLTASFNGNQVLSLGKSNLITVHKGPLTVNIGGSVDADAATEFEKTMLYTADTDSVVVQANGENSTSPFDSAYDISHFISDLLLLI